MCVLQKEDPGVVWSAWLAVCYNKRRSRRLFLDDGRTRTTTRSASELQERHSVERHSIECRSKWLISSHNI